jgi:hypothetical protein
MLLNPRYGAIGLLAMPYFAVFEFLSPLFALGGLVVTVVLLVLGEISVGYFVAFVLVSIGLGVMLTTAALVLEEFSYRRYRGGRDIARLLVYSVVANIGYQQLHDIWRAVGYVDILRRKTGWGAQQRRGFVERPVASSDASS